MYISSKLESQELFDLLSAVRFAENYKKVQVKRLYGFMLPTHEAQCEWGKLLSISCLTMLISMVTPLLAMGYGTLLVGLLLWNLLVIILSPISHTQGWCQWSFCWNVTTELRENKGSQEGHNWTTGTTIFSPAMSAVSKKTWFKLLYCYDRNSSLLKYTNKDTNSNRERNSSGLMVP